jgi:phosphoglycolate phosphatase
MQSQLIDPPLTASLFPVDAMSARRSCPLRALAWPGAGHTRRPDSYQASPLPVDIGEHRTQPHTQSHTVTEMRLAHLLFDLDGTLTDPKPGITRCIQHALKTLGREVPEADALEWCIGPPLIQSFAWLLESDDPALIKQAVFLYRERFAEIGLYENQVYDGIPEALQVLHERGFRLFLATSKPLVFAKRILEHFDLHRFFTEAFGSELNGHLTDKPSLVRHVLARTGGIPGATMIIGDRKFDLLGGQANGLHTAAVTYGYGSEEELRQAGADILFHSPQQIGRELTLFFQGDQR